jgi:hypothetical protein
MKTCEEHELGLSAWIDGELPPTLAAEAIEHALECASCAAFFRGARALQEDARSLAASDGLGKSSAARLWAQIRERTGVGGGSSAPAHVAGLRHSGWLRAAALIVLGLGGGYATSRLAAPAVAPLAGGVSVARVESPMSDARFVTLADELMRSDPRYQRAMLEVLRLVPAIESGEGLGGRREGAGLVTIAEQEDAPRGTLRAPR